MTEHKGKIINNTREWIEWVPNISEGRDKNLIRKIVSALDSVQDIYVIHKDIGFDANRTVLTVIGTTVSLENAIDRLISLLEKHINMSHHSGAHPRLGALDVSPFIPLDRKNSQTVIDWAYSLAANLSRKYNLPIYLYEKSSGSPERKNLASIRKGEYENLKSKMELREWRPDFGTEFNPVLGATVLGVRDFLIAYNINLESTDLKVARKIASSIRSNGPAGRPSAIPGLKAIGWHMESFGKVQVSTNITDIKKTTMLEVFRSCRKLAGERDIAVTESELIGLIPGAMLRTMVQKNDMTGSELAKIMGLEFCGIRDLEERTIEYNFIKKSGIQL